MISEQLIDEVTRRLVAAYDPDKIYLFGSYAWGEPTDDSDLDIMVVVPASDQKKYLRSHAASYALKDLMVPKDVMVYTVAEFERSASDKTTLAHKIKFEGRSLYAKA